MIGLLSMGANEVLLRDFARVMGETRLKHSGRHEAH